MNAPHLWNLHKGYLIGCQQYYKISPRNVKGLSQDDVKAFASLPLIKTGRMTPLSASSMTSIWLDRTKPFYGIKGRVTI
jgi:hypothetical protein